MNLKIFLKKILNTFLSFNLSFVNYPKIYSKNFFFFTYVSKLCWFLPSNFQALYWKNSESIGHGYNHFIQMDRPALLLKKEINNYASKNDKILDICCSVGRMLNSLSEDGYNNLYGVDINKVAIERSKEVFIKLKNTHLICSSAENFLPSRKNNEFDVVFSLSASLELIPPSFPLVREISRITKKYFICLIDENGHAYPRFWRYEFKKNGLTLVKYYKINSSLTIFVLKKNN